MRIPTKTFIISISIYQSEYKHQSCCYTAAIVGLINVFSRFDGNTSTSLNRSL